MGGLPQKEIDNITEGVFVLFQGLIVGFVVFVISSLLLLLAVIGLIVYICVR